MRTLKVKNRRDAQYSHLCLQIERDNEKIPYVSNVVSNDDKEIPQTKIFVTEPSERPVETVIDSGVQALV